MPSEVCEFESFDHLAFKFWPVAGFIFHGLAGHAVLCMGSFAEIELAGISHDIFLFFLIQEIVLPWSKPILVLKPG